MIDKKKAVRIRARREQMLITQKQVADMIDGDAEYVEAIERGLIEPTEPELRRICQYLCIDEGYLSGGQSLDDVVLADQDATDRMVAWIREKFRALANHAVRQVVFEQIKEIIEVPC